MGARLAVILWRVLVGLSAGFVAAIGVEQANDGVSLVPSLFRCLREMM